MNSIKYIITTNSSCSPIVAGTTEQELKSLFESLSTCQSVCCGAMRILDVQRWIVTNSGKVTYNHAALTFDKTGLEIRDMYGNLLDSYEAHEPGKKRFKVIGHETWKNEIEVDAEDEDAAIAIVKDLVAEGGFDVLEGYCIDVDYEVFLTEGE